MSEDILVPDELIIDFSLPKEEIKKQLDDYEKACNEAFKKWGLSEDKKETLYKLLENLKFTIHFATINTQKHFPNNINFSKFTIHFATINT